MVVEAIEQTNKQNWYGRVISEEWENEVKSGDRIEADGKKREGENSGKNCIDCEQV